MPSIYSQINVSVRRSRKSIEAPFARKLLLADADIKLYNGRE
jgi:hypothetical protein